MQLELYPSIMEVSFDANLRLSRAPVKSAFPYSGEVLKERR